MAKFDLSFLSYQNIGQIDEEEYFNSIPKYKLIGVTLNQDITVRELSDEVVLYKNKFFYEVNIFLDWDDDFNIDIKIGFGKWNEFVYFDTIEIPYIKDGAIYQDLIYDVVIGEDITISNDQLIRFEADSEFFSVVIIPELLGNILYIDLDFTIVNDNNWYRLKYSGETKSAIE